MGFDAEWGVLSSAEVGHQHIRERLWIVATNSNKTTNEFLGKRETEIRKQWIKGKRLQNWVDFLVDNDGKPYPAWRQRGKRQNPRPIMWRKSDGMAFGVDRISAIGNGQDSRVAATAFELLRARLEETDA
jgi:DNA (cytosine-5)-methyltransferase 1